MAEPSVNHTTRQAPPPPSRAPTPLKKKDRPFFFDQYPHRKVCLRLAYHGLPFDGLAKQQETANTVEGILEQHLRQLKLVCPEKGPQEVRRCGRTDKGVSALGNAYSCILRSSSWPPGHPRHDPSVQEPPPLDYTGMLNSVLPLTIRIIGFAYVEDSFDARFSCTARSYRYYFSIRHFSYTPTPSITGLKNENKNTEDVGEENQNEVIHHPVLLNIENMRKGAQYFLGEHNFRNFCKMDVVNVSNYVRTVYEVAIKPSEHLPELIYYFEITANSFLYHQIRCTMEVLFLIGKGLEAPEVVQQLLDAGDCKPLYPLADGTPLILWECHFGNIAGVSFKKGDHDTTTTAPSDPFFYKNTLQWCISRRALHEVHKELQDLSVALLVKSAWCAGMRRQVLEWYPNTKDSTVSNRNTQEAPYALGDRAYREEFGVPRPSSSGVKEAPSPLITDNWSIVGADWTTDRIATGSRQQRKKDLLASLRFEDESYRPPSPPSTRGGETNVTGSVYTASAYVPLHRRAVERTYEEEIANLSEKKKKRYEENTRKKVMGDEINAANKKSKVT